MGFIAGKKVTVVLNAPLKDPIEYEILGYKLSLRRSEAEQIEVIGESEAKEVMKKDSSFDTIYADDCDDEWSLSPLQHCLRLA